MSRLSYFCKFAACAMLLAIGVAAPAQGAVILQYEAGSATPLGGGSVSVPIYLHETLTDGPSSVIAPDGLYSIGVTITRTSGDATITAFTRNSAFDQSNPGSTVGATEAKVNAEQAVNFGSGVNPDGSGLILFATATIQQGSSLSGFSISDFGPGDQIVDYGFEAHDDNVLAGAFNVAAVPEPTSLALLGVAGALLIRRRTAC